MKTFVIIAGLLMATSTGYAAVPEAVKAAFKQDYPASEVSLWEQTREGYAATFREEEGLKKAIYSAEGTWIETRTRILLRDIPTGIQSAIKAENRSARMTYIGRVKRPDSLFFRIESETSDAVIVRIFSESGEMASEEAFYFSTSKA